MDVRQKTFLLLVLLGAVVALAVATALVILLGAFGVKVDLFPLWAVIGAAFVAFFLVKGWLSNRRASRLAESLGMDFSDTFEALVLHQLHKELPTDQWTKEWVERQLEVKRSLRKAFVERSAK